MPLVGWDRAGNRLGMGGGYYDRTLQSVSGPLLVGIAYSVQEVDDIPRESWDVALDIVLTEAGIHVCSGGRGRHREKPIA
jgi:5-formyltetrahydrofolate cyclo-ligase